MDQDTVGPSPSATYMHIPPLFMCEVSWPPDVYAVFRL